MVKKNFIAEISIDNTIYKILDLEKIAKTYNFAYQSLPVTLRILLENSLRNSINTEEFEEIIQKFKNWQKEKKSSAEILYYPSRVLMQDFTGVPAVVDLAAMREALSKKGGDPKKINPISPVDLVIDHSVQVDNYGSKDSLEKNNALEMERNIERYKFLKWGQEAFDNFRAVPPGTGICHQVNLEYLSTVVSKREIDGEEWLIPDTLVGTDSHTTMVNGAAVLGWGVGGIEAEAAMLGNAISMIIPEVVGFELSGKLNEGVTATDLVLTITEQLREEGVVGKFVEFYGSSLSELSLADRATIANMSPEFGSTCGFFATDAESLKYLHLSGRAEKQIEIVEKYSKKQKLFRDDAEKKEYSVNLKLNLSEVVPSLAGPKRPQDRCSLPQVKDSYLATDKNLDLETKYAVEGEDYALQNGDIVIAAITSCTNTSNPSVMLAAGLVARKALKLGLKPKPFVKTSLGPGSQVVAEYYKKSGLQEDLDNFGFNIVGFGCTTCIGNSGPLKANIEKSIKENNLSVTSVLSGNRNFEGRVHPLTKANYLASPPLVVAYSILGNLTKDITTESLGKDKNGKDIYLKDIWPTNAEIAEILEKSVTREMFISKYATVLQGEKSWQEIEISKDATYSWDNSSTYIQNPPFFEGEINDKDIKDAKILALFGDSITTDHISPAGVIAEGSPAAKYLQENSVAKKDFNSYGSRRGNHEVMMRGTFANIRIKNEMLDGKEGGYTLDSSNNETSIYDAAMGYIAEGRNLVVVAGKEYGTGSSRDWAAKGTMLLGVKAVISESFERIHRSNLVGMGVLPLCFENGDSRKSLALTGQEEFSIFKMELLEAQGKVTAEIKYADGTKKEISLKVRIDTPYELENFKAGGVLRKVVNEAV